MSSDALTPPFYSSSAATSSSLLPQPQSSSSAATSAIIVVIVIASAIILSVSIYLLLRFLSKNLGNRRRHHQTHPNDVVLSRHSSTSGDIRASAHGDHNGAALLDSLPLFTFRSVNKGNLTEGDCAVCLSRFEPDDQLRLLPLCCHAFHGACIDAWIVANRTCPLCRSSVVPTDRDVMDKINQHSDDPANNGNEDGSNESNRSRSFRIEIGSISRRRNGGGASAEGDRRSYSVGSFEYIVDQIGEYEVSLVDYTDKEYPTSIGAASAEEALAAEVGSGGGRSGSHNWLRDYVDRLGVSFRSSGRFFSGSSRRSEAAVTAVLEDLEANRVGEEISELFRWLSGV